MNGELRLGRRRHAQLAQRFDVPGNRPRAQVQFDRHAGLADRADDFFEPAPGTERLAEPVQAQRTVRAAMRLVGYDAERVVNRQRAHAIRIVVRAGNHRTARGGERRPMDHVALDTGGQRVRDLAARTAVFTRMKIFDQVGRLGRHFPDDLVVRAAIRANRNRDRDARWTDHPGNAQRRAKSDAGRDPQSASSDLVVVDHRRRPVPRQHDGGIGRGRPRRVIGADNTDVVARARKSISGLEHTRTRRQMAGRDDGDALASVAHRGQL